MNYQVLKLEFQTAVHFGKGGLTRSDCVLHADTIFSALCIEALKMNLLQELVDSAMRDRIRISDGLPFIGDELYIPKPFMKIDHKDQGDSKKKKAMKKLEYVPVSALDAYAEGELDVQQALQHYKDEIGSFVLNEKARVPEGEDAEPYAVHAFRFKKNSGLYICIGFENSQNQMLIQELLESLSYQGIGGKLSSGYGKFSLHMTRPHPELEERLMNDHYNNYISLATALPSEEELKQVVPSATFKLIRRSGFIQSETFSDTMQKKKDCYLFAPGSCFQQKFNGCILNVAPEGGHHPVYRYAKPMFMGVR